MSKAREIIKNNKAKTGIIPTMGNWAKKFFASAAYNGQVWGTWMYSNSRHIGWFIVTTGMITALPLIFEIKREMAHEELERMQINMGIAEGRSPQELAQIGLTSAIDPKVLV